MPPGLAPRMERRHVTAMVVIVYLIAVGGAIGLEVRPPHSAPLVETFLIRACSLLLALGGLLGIPAAWTGRRPLERLGASFAMGGCLIGLTQAVLLDVLPSWPPLSRPVLTIVGMTISAAYFATRLSDLRGDPGPDAPDAVDAIHRADQLRGHSPA